MLTGLLIQLSKTFLFTEVKLNLPGFHYVNIIYVLFQRKWHSKAAAQRCSIKNLFRKISKTSKEHVVIVVLFYQVAGLELATLSKSRARYRCFAVNFVAFIRTTLCKTIVNSCCWTLRGVVENKCSRNQKFVIEVTKAFRNKCSRKRFWCFINSILQIIWSS